MSGISCCAFHGCEQWFHFRCLFKEQPLYESIYTLRYFFSHLFTPVSQFINCQAIYVVISSQKLRPGSANKHHRVESWLVKIIDILTLFIWIKIGRGWHNYLTPSVLNRERQNMIEIMSNDFQYLLNIWPRTMSPFCITTSQRVNIAWDPWYFNSLHDEGKPQCMVDSPHNVLVMQKASSCYDMMACHCRWYIALSEIWDNLVF